MAIVSLVIVALCLKNGKKDITIMDTALLGAALIALLVWLFAKQPTIATILLVLAETLGTIPSVRKAWHKPYQETLSMWSLNSFRHLLAIVALQQYSIITLLNPLAWVIINGLFSVMLIGRRRSYNSVT